VFVVVDPLRTVEDILGDVESSPTYIIYMFLVEPNTISVKKVAAFMYSIAVPVINPIKCINACMELDISSSLVSSAMKNWYSTWAKNSYKPHKAEYYSMSSKQWLWKNGEALDQLDAVWPEITVMEFGLESTGCQTIKLTIEHIRSMSSKCHAK